MMRAPAGGPSVDRMPGTRTFLVEHYVPALDEATARNIAGRLSSASAEMREEGVRIQWTRAVALPREESLLCFVEAESEGEVIRLRDRAGFGDGHVQEALTLEASSAPTRSCGTPPESSSARS
jgi:hypothetical protein